MKSERKRPSLASIFKSNCFNQIWSVSLYYYTACSFCISIYVLYCLTPQISLMNVILLLIIFISDLNEFYHKIPDDKPIHIARVWDRYSVNEGKKLITLCWLTNHISCMLHIIHDYVQLCSYLNYFYPVLDFFLFFLFFLKQ